MEGYRLDSSGSGCGPATRCLRYVDVEQAVEYELLFSFAGYTLGKEQVQAETVSLSAK